MIEGLFHGQLTIERLRAGLTADEIKTLRGLIDVEEVVRVVYEATVERPQQEQHSTKTRRRSTETKRVRAA